MKARAVLLTSALSLGIAGSSAFAQAVVASELGALPFQNDAPGQVLPTLSGMPEGPEAQSGGQGLGVPVAVPSLPSTIPAAAAVETAAMARPGVFGIPRVSNPTGMTRVVFDLPTGARYTLMPSVMGMQIEVEGVAVSSAQQSRLGNQVGEYQASGQQVSLKTDTPLGADSGWRALETTIVSGGRVLILEFGPDIRGGALASVRGQVRLAGGVTPAAAAVNSQRVTTPAASPAAVPVPATITLSSIPSTPGYSTPVAATRPAAVSSTQPAASSGVSGSTQPSTVLNPTASPVQGNENLPPGDSVRSSSPAISSSLVETHDNTPLALSGRVVGGSAGTIALGVPRVGKNPGWTRLVFELPPGTTYRIVPNKLGVRLELGGVTVNGLDMGAKNVSPEVRSWGYELTSSGVNVNLVTGTPTTPTSGWRAELLPPATGTRSRLVVDLSPAMADTTPLAGQQKVLAAVPPMPVSRGLAVLATPANYAQPRIVLDAGHGGKFPGAIGSVVEKTVTLEVAQRVRDILKSAGVDVLMTRESDKELSSELNKDLELRPALANNGAQLFVSIHANAMTTQTALRGFGIETWWNANHSASRSLADALQRNMLQTTGAFDRGLHSHRSLSVLRNSKVPAALVEVGFVSHPVDGLNLKHNNYLDRVALGIASGIREALVSGYTASASTKKVVPTSVPAPVTPLPLPTGSESFRPVNSPAVTGPAAPPALPTSPADDPW